MNYESNVNKVLLNLKGRLTKAADVSKLQRTVAAYLMASNWDRISEGKAVNGNLIGAYSVKPIYVNPKNSPRAFEPKGKTGRTFFKGDERANKKFKLATGVNAGKVPHKTRYFAAGYFGYRATIGREIGFVNLQLTNRLRKDWRMEQDGSDWVVGWGSSYGTKVSQGNEERFGQLIFGVTEQNKTKVVEISDNYVKKALENNNER